MLHILTCIIKIYLPCDIWVRYGNNRTMCEHEKKDKFKSFIVISSYSLKHSHFCRRCLFFYIPCFRNRRERWLLLHRTAAEASSSLIIQALVLFFSYRAKYHEVDLNILIILIEICKTC